MPTTTPRSPRPPRRPRTRAAPARDRHPPRQPPQPAKSIHPRRSPRPSRSNPNEFCATAKRSTRCSVSATGIVTRPRAGRERYARRFVRARRAGMPRRGGRRWRTRWDGAWLGWRDWAMVMSVRSLLSRHEDASW
eukprot:CCRYP_017650-RC/>CCRYP_017650-RC protein AED:0.46 eAED:0.46 QI:0/-1/0/1/-1/0/1/0/134